MSEILLVDQDGVMCDTIGRAYEIAQSEGHSEVCHYEMQDYWFKGLPIASDVMTDILRRPNFYSELTPITGAVRAINHLRRFYDVRVCSAPMSGVEASCEEEKRDWLAWYFDKRFAESAIITKDKSTVIGRLLVEDNPDVDKKPGVWQPVMFHQPWNRHRTDLPRMYNWGDLHVIKKIMEA